MTWSDVKWDRNRLFVRSPKTEHHVDGDGRFIPLFPEVREALEQLGRGAASARIFDRFDPFHHKTTRDKLTQAIVAAGLKPWPKLWQNLRSSRITECANEPDYLLSAWFGNTPEVRRINYLQVRDEDYAAASGAESGAAIQGTAGSAEFRPSFIGSLGSVLGLGGSDNGRNRT